MPILAPSVPMNVSDTLELSRVRKRLRIGQAERIRTAAGLSLAEIAEPVGVSAATVHRWETGQRTPHGDAAVRYGRLLTRLERELEKEPVAGEDGPGAA